MIPEFPEAGKGYKETIVQQFHIQTFSEKEPGRPDKENEDSVVVLDNENVLVAMIGDGASSLATITDTGGKGVLSGIFAVTYAREGIENSYQTTQYATILLRAANNHINEALRNNGINPNSVPAEELPQEVATLLRIDKKTKTIDIVQVGDTACIVVKKDGRVELAVERTPDQYDLQAITFAQQIARERDISLKDALKTSDVGKLMLRSRSITNAPEGQGYGALNGSEHMERYIKGKTYQVADIRSIILLTDGMIPPTQHFEDEPDWEEICAIIQSHGLSGLYQNVYKKKSSDPTLDRYPRFKQYDDASGIQITIEEALQ